MFSLNNVSVHFNGTYIFRDVGFLINSKDRIGLVGKNGSGKSTILKVLKGILKPETGELAIPSGSTVGYLPQELKVESTRSVFDEALTAFDTIINIRKKIERLEHEISHPETIISGSYLANVQLYNDLNEKLRVLDGWSIEAGIEKVLTGLGFKRQEFGNSLSTFSYGWQMRVELAKILLTRPDLILLDEPTNHLDIESIQWLEDFLISYPGAVVIVSHDRALLDNVTKRTIEITKGQIFDYKASYTDFVRLREERIEKQTADYNNQQRQVQQIERFIERFRYKNTKARQVQSKIKQLEKLDEIEIDELDRSAIHFRFPPAPPGGKVFVEAVRVSKFYGQKKVFENVDFVALNGEKIAFVGRNGEGKTTFSKIITGNLDYSGTLKIGHNVTTGYYAQNQGEMLDQEKTVFQTIDDVATGEIRKNIRGLLGSFLFGEEDIDKKVKVLSGGEKARLSLAKLLLKPVNLLVLDEPTNHLDMQSKDILKNALLQFSGTLILVSHDRDFLQGLTRKVVEFRNGSCKVYLGDIYDFLRDKKIGNLNELNHTMAKEQKPEKQATVNKLLYEKKKQTGRDIRKLEQRIEQCEHSIEQIEKEMEVLDGILANPGNHEEQVKSGEVFKEYNQLKETLASRMKLWEQLHDELEGIKEGL